MSLREDVEEANKEIEELKGENKKLRDKLYSHNNVDKSQYDDENKVDKLTTSVKLLSIAKKE